MKIITKYTKENPKEKPIFVTEAKYIGDYAVRVDFNNKHSSLIDFKPFLESTRHPSIKKYTNEKLFKKFKIIHGNLNWNDYEMIFPIEDLYEGKI
jgi:hypothetical protein